MHRPSDGKIGIREFFSLIVLTMGIKFTDMTTTLLFDDGDTAAWMIPIMVGLVSLPSLLVLLALLKKYENKNLIEIIYKITGKYVGFIFGLILFILSFSAMVLNTRNYATIMNTLYFPKTPTMALMIFGGIGIYFIANRGFEVIGRTGWIILTYVVGAFSILIIISWNDLTVYYLYPLRGPGLFEIMKSVPSSISLIAELFFFAIVYPMVRSYKTFRNGALLGLGFSIIAMAVFLAVFIMAFDYPSVNKLAFPFHQLAMTANLGRFIQHAEAFFLAFWTVAAFVRFAVYLYVTTATLGYTLKLKEMEPLLLPIGTLSMLLGIIPENIIKTMFVLRQDVLYRFASPLIILLPILLWVMSKIKGGQSQ